MLYRLIAWQAHCDETGCATGQLLIAPPDAEPGPWTRAELAALGWEIDSTNTAGRGPNGGIYAARCPVHRVKPLTTAIACPSCPLVPDNIDAVAGPCCLEPTAP